RPRRRRARGGRGRVRRARPVRLGRRPARRAGHGGGPARRGALGGERQLVAIARAYLAQPDLLVLDEATSAVDPATEVRIARALDSLTAGRSTITIAHRLSTAEASDLVVVVDQIGRASWREKV